MTTYELTINSTGEDFFNARKQLIDEFICWITGVEVTADWRTPHTGRIVSCLNPCNNFESVIATVYFDDTDETKNYGIAAAINCAGLLFVDESMKALYDDFKAANENIKHQEFLAAQEVQRREKEENKKAEQLKKAEANFAKQKEHSIKEFNKRATQSKCEVKETTDFFYALGWLSTHVTSVSAVLPDYLESAFVKNFGEEATRRVTDSSRRTSGGYAMQWTWAFKMHLKNPETIPMTLNGMINDTGKIIANTSFIWDLVADYGFKFGKEQDVVEIMRHVPIEYVPMFVEGSKA